MKIINKYGKEYSYNRLSITVSKEVYEVLKEISELSNGRKISPFINDILIGLLPKLKAIVNELKVSKKLEDEIKENIAIFTSKYTFLKSFFKDFTKK